MAGILQHLRSSTLDKRPNPGSMVDGQVAINYASGSPGLFFKDNAGALVKVGPVHVGTTAPNVSPASGGTAGNSRGEQWLDTSGGSYVMKIWDGSAWRTEAGEFVNATGDIMTGALGMPPASAGSPTIYFSGDTDTGLYSPGANQLAISTGGTGRLFVDASGNVGIGSNSPNGLLALGFADAGSASLEFRTTSYSNLAQIVASNPSSDTGEITFRTRTGGSAFDRAKIDGSGRFLVGTSSSTAEAKFIVQGGATAAGGAVNIQRNATTASAGSSIGFIGFTNSANNVGAYISAEGDGTWSAGTSHPTRLVFSTTADGASSPTERMRISQDGKLTHTAGSSVFEISPGSIFVSSASWSSGAGTANVKWSATTGLLSYDTSSRLVKDDIEDCPYGLDAVRQLQPRIYSRKDSGQREVGFIADELQNVIPELVPTGPKSVLTGNDADKDELIPIAVNYDKFVAVLTKALQEALAKIETLEARLTAAGIE